MPQCFVKSCGNYYEKTKSKGGVVYHVFPNSKAEAKRWAELCTGDKDATPTKFARVCSEHFHPDSYKRDIQHELLGLPLRKKLIDGVMPTMNLPRPNSKTIGNRSFGDVSKVSEEKPSGNGGNLSLPIDVGVMPTEELNNDGVEVGGNVSNLENVYEKSGASEENPMVIEEKSINVKGKSDDMKGKLEDIKEKSFEKVKEVKKRNKVPLRQLNTIKMRNVKLAENRDINASPKYKIPMRSSTRIAKKRSMDFMAEYARFDAKLSKSQSHQQRLINKIKFMNGLRLKFEKNENDDKNNKSFHKLLVSLSKYECEEERKKFDG